MEKLTLAIGGMSCGHCVGAVTKALKGVEGVTVEEVKLGAATVSYDPSKTSAASLAGIVSEAGYPAQPA